MKKILSHIRFVFVAIEFATTLLCLVILMYLFPKYNRTLRIKWSNLQLKILGIKLETKGILNNDVNMYILNHQSMLDIIVFEAIHTRDLCWIAKQEIGKIPLFGHILKAPKMIAVDRESKKSLLQLISDVRDRVANNRPICIFPEGTRSQGDTLLKFKTGSKIIAQKLSLKVQPIVLINTRNILDSKSFTSNSGVVSVVYLDVVDISQDDWFENMHQNMQKVLDNELANSTSNR